MRSIGSRRGVPILRASVQQSARRRMASWLGPHAGAAGAHDEAPAFSTRAFFDRIRECVLPRMAPALEVDGAEVRYFGAADLGLWAMNATQGLVLAYECADTPTLLAERARRWLSCLRTRTAPGILSRSWGQPVYGARLEPASDSIDVVWATPGPWCGFVLAEEPQPRLWSVPPHWRQAGLASV